MSTPTEDDVRVDDAASAGPDDPAGPDDDPASPAGPASTGVSARWRTAAAVLLVVALVAAGAALWTARTAAYQPTEGSAEVGFSRDMVAHHQQAVVMSFLVRDLTDDEEVRGLSLDLITGQAEEQGMLTAWLRRHDVPASSSVPQMQWMTTPVPGEDMSGHAMVEGEAPTMEQMGLATDEQLTGLAGLQGTAAEVDYLQLMRAHHVGGTEMIDAYLARSTDDELESIAEGMRTAQTREIRIIDDLLAERGVTG